MSTLTFTASEILSANSLADFLGVLGINGLDPKGLTPNELRIAMEAVLACRDGSRYAVWSSALGAPKYLVVLDPRLSWNGRGDICTRTYSALIDEVQSVLLGE